MELIQRNSIYDRLYAMRLDIEHQTAPNPRYISEKIIECHGYIEEVEKYSIEVNREISALQQALNNAKTDYEIKKDNLLINNEDIKNLPNIKDREARANSRLRTELGIIKDYENHIVGLNSLTKIITLKNKNLDRTNSDLKLLVRTLEAQVKMGEANVEDKVTKSLMDEFKKSMIDEGEDPFERVETKEIKEETIDLSNPLNINNLLTQPIEGVKPEQINEQVSQTINEQPAVDDIDALFGPDPFKKEPEKTIIKVDEIPINLDDLFEQVSKDFSEKKAIQSEPIVISNPASNIEASAVPATQEVLEWTNSENEEETLEDVPTCDTWLEMDQNAPVELENQKENSIDLSSIDFTKNLKGGEKNQTKSDDVQSKRDEAGLIQKEGHRTETGIDIDDLLSTLTT